MRYAIILTALAAAVADAQQCQKLADIKELPDPLVQFPPKVATFPCDMGSPIPLGPVPTGCADFEIIVARGTSEPGKLGMVIGDPLVARVKRDMPGVNVRGYPVQYPAAAGMQSSPKGVADVQKRLEDQAKECPNEKFALVGYSQGGGVVTSASKGLPQALQDKVVAVVLYGAGNGNSVVEGLRGKTLANCAPGDFACPNAGQGPGHVSYNNQGTVWHDRSSKYIAAAYNGKPMGQKLAKSETAAEL